MNHQLFEEWFIHTLLLKIAPNSLIVMDNASYYSRKKQPTPTKSCTKGKLMDWLSSKGVTYSDKCLKSELWEIAKRNKPQHPIYVIDEATSQAGKAKPC